MKITKTILITVLYGYLLIHSWNTLSADESYMAGQKELSKGNIEKAIEYANKSIRKNPEEPRYRYGRAKILLASTVDSTDKDNEKVNAHKDLIKAQTLNPKNLVTLRNIVPLYYFLSIHDLTQTNSNENIDETYIKHTESYLKTLKQEYPNDLGVHILAAKYEKKLNLIEWNKLA